MSESTKDNAPEEVQKTSLGTPLSRRSFLKFAGVSAAAAATLGLAGCGDENVPSGPSPEPEPQPMPNPGPQTVSFGTGDASILNFAFALEQLEAAFYIQVLNNRYSGMPSSEAQLLEDIRDHEIAHRDWFSAVLTSIAPDAKIPNLTPDFSSVNFASRDSVLSIASALEETGVGAYNGAGQFISTGDAGLAYLLQAGKIVSVEARHASAINNLISPGSTAFAPDRGSGMVGADSNGLDQAFSVQQVVDRAGPFITENLDVSGVGSQG